MAKTYRPYLPEQDLLLPPSLRDWLPENHLAYFVAAALAVLKQFRNRTQCLVDLIGGRKLLGYIRFQQHKLLPDA
jgi:hypothetical protein